MMTFFHSENKTICHKEYNPLWKHPSAQSQFLDIQLQDTNANKWVRAFFVFFFLEFINFYLKFPFYRVHLKWKGKTNEQTKKKTKKKEKEKKNYYSRQTTSKLIESTYLKFMYNI